MNEGMDIKKCGENYSKTEVEVTLRAQFVCYVYNKYEKKHWKL